MNNIEDKVDKCIWKQLIDNSNKLYRKFAYRTDHGIGCDVCAGDKSYHKYKKCYKSFKEIK